MQESVAADDVEQLVAMTLEAALVDGASIAAQGVFGIIQSGFG